MKRYIIANWKSHKTNETGKLWLDAFVQGYKGGLQTEIIVAPPMVSLDYVANQIHLSGKKNITVAAQDVSPFPLGSYTGAVAADLLKPFAKYVIIGHSERKRYFHETEQDIANKLAESIDSGIIPIICIESVHFFARLVHLVDLQDNVFIVAYTPVDALNFSIPESPEKVSEAVAEIDQIFPGCAIVYGGAVTPENSAKYISTKGLSGLFVGSASLEVESFMKICAQAAG